MILFYSCLQVLRSNMRSLSHPFFFSFLIHTSLCAQLPIEPRSLPFRTYVIFVLFFVMVHSFFDGFRFRSFKYSNTLHKTECERRKLNLFHTKNSKHFDILKNSLLIFIFLYLYSVFFPTFSYRL